MAVRVVEVDAPVIAWPAGYVDTLLREALLRILIGGGLHAQGHVVQLRASLRRRPFRRLEEGHLLPTAPKERLPAAFVGNGHPQEVHVEPFGPFQSLAHRTTWSIPVVLIWSLLFTMGASLVEMLA